MSPIPLHPDAQARLAMLDQAVHAEEQGADTPRPATAQAAAPQAKTIG